MGSTSVVEIASLITARLSGDPKIRVSGVSLNSNTVEKNELFAALPGRTAHGVTFVSQAIKRGASAILTDPAGVQWLDQSDLDIELPVLLVSDPRASLGKICKLVYSDPAAGMILLGVTGTNGKSTTTSMIYQAARAVGIKAGLIGTLATAMDGEEVSSVRTTPEAPDLFRTIARMKASGVKLIAMEVSSIALSEYRVNGVEFDCVGFTNLSHDHLDYHDSMVEYFSAKSQLFSHQYARSALICTDSSWGVKLCDSIAIPFESVGNVGSPDWKITEDHDRGSWLLRGPRYETHMDSLAMPGTMNALNAALALAMLDRVGIHGGEVVTAICGATVPGRAELVGTRDGVSVFVDYAHSPESIREFLTGLRSQFGGRIITVVGAGGDRDASKRAEMGQAGASGSDVLIVTDDNPRSEDPTLIRQQLLAGAARVSGCEVFEMGDRRMAIAQALESAHSHDVVAILGKGHERGQEMHGHVIEFSDVDVVAEMLQGGNLND